MVNMFFYIIILKMLLQIDENKINIALSKILFKSIISAIVM